MIPKEVRSAAEQHPYPLLFATVSGAHLYGFPSADSDWDLRGVHVLSGRDVWGLMPLEETVEISSKEGIELDLVTHDVRKFFGLLLKPNGYVLEQLFSPLVVHATQEFDDLKRIATGCITRYHVHHYLGFADSQWKLFQQETPRRVKPLLYVFRVLLTGIHLMQTGKIEANLPHLNEAYQLSFLPELIERKVHGTENQAIDGAELAFYEKQFAALRTQLVDASECTSLPGTPSAKNALHDLLIQIRLKTLKNIIG